MELRNPSRFARFAGFVLIYNLLVILWGAFVRATGSGAGCGAHWPTCNGQIIPRAAQVDTLIEFAHRVSSGLALPLVIVLLVWAWRSYPRGNPIRVSAALAVFFTITEALVGAGLVLFELVADNDSAARAFWMMAHLINTFLLLASIGVTLWWGLAGAPEGRLHWRSRVGLFSLLSLLALGVLGASGAVTALGDTLYPAGSLREGFAQDFSPTAHFLIRLRVLHPVIAVTTALLVGGFALWLRRRRGDAQAQFFTTALISLFGVQILLGILNIVLLAPVWMQLVHLLVSDLVWLSLVGMVAVVLGRPDLFPDRAHHHVHDRVNQPGGVG